MWVARNKDNCLFCFNSKPIRTNYNEVGWDGWIPNYEEYATMPTAEAMMYCSWMRLHDSLFPNLKWEDEPLEIELLPVHSTREHSMLEYLSRAREVADEGSNWINNDAGGCSFCREVKDMIHSVICRIKRDIEVYKIEEK